MSALPDPCYVLKTDNTWFRVDHAATVNDVNVAYKDGTTYRNELSGGYVGGSNIAAGGGFDYIAGFQLADDVFNHTAPHDNLLNRFERQFVGASRAIGGTTVTGSANITVPDSSLIAVGMAITGAGITSGSLVSKIVSATVITITQIATASATIALTVGGTDVLARCWLDEFKEYSAYPPQLTGQAVKLWPSA